jgi:aminoglycoside phosphotransferase (APT) family kinase protein
LAAGHPEGSRSTAALTWPCAHRILAAHGLGPLRALGPLAGGQINQVYLLNGEFVLRIRPAEKSGAAFLTERTLYDRLRRLQAAPSAGGDCSLRPTGGDRVPVPEVLAVDTSRAIVPADYMLTRRLPGESLARAWVRAAPPEREQLARAFADLLRQVHAARYPSVGGFEAGELRPARSWQQYLAARFDRRLGILRRFPNADRELLQAIERFRRSATGALEPDGGAEDARLVHRDLHFGNVLVLRGRITGVLDFEAAVAAPVDYELDQICRFLRYPQLFVEPALEASAARPAFAGLWPALRRCYGELFGPRRLAERLALYSLEYDLAALRDCYAGRWGEEAHRHVRRRIAAALEGRHLPGA